MIGWEEKGVGLIGETMWNFRCVDEMRSLDVFL